MKQLIYLSTLIIFSLLSIKSEAQNFDVRQTRWGMTTDDVIKAEGAEPLRREKGFDNDLLLVYDLYIENRLVNCSYHFLNGRLYQVTYRYNWGKWQDSQPKDFKTRQNSLYSLWQSIDNKKFKLSKTWHYLNQFDSPQNGTLKKCLEPVDKDPLANLTAVEDCFNRVVDISKEPPLYAVIDYENIRTDISIQFPLKNHEYRNIFIAWVTFTAKDTPDKHSDF